jgi:hypothetical protein
MGTVHILWILNGDVDASRKDCLKRRIKKNEIVIEAFVIRSEILGKKTEFRVFGLNGLL